MISIGTAIFGACVAALAPFVTAWAMARCLWHSRTEVFTLRQQLANAKELAEMWKRDAEFDRAENKELRADGMALIKSLSDHPSDTVSGVQSLMKVLRERADQEGSDFDKLARDAAEAFAKNEVENFK